jgi:hypothetical protein
MRGKFDECESKGLSPFVDGTILYFINEFEEQAHRLRSVTVKNKPVMPAYWAIAQRDFLELCDEFKSMINIMRDVVGVMKTECTKMKKTIRDDGEMILTKSVYDYAMMPTPEGINEDDEWEDRCSGPYYDGESPLYLYGRCWCLYIGPVFFPRESIDLGVCPDMDINAARIAALNKLSSLGDHYLSLKEKIVIDADIPDVEPGPLPSCLLGNGNGSSVSLASSERFVTLVSDGDVPEWGNSKEGE